MRERIPLSDLKTLPWQIFKKVVCSTTRVREHMVFERGGEVGRFRDAKGNALAPARGCIIDVNERSARVRESAEACG